MTDPAPQQLSPGEILDAERFMEYEAAVARDSPLVGRVVSLLDRDGMSVCDVGGASGVFLQEVLRRAGRPVEACVMEVNAAYRDRLVDPAIGFVEQSILDNRIADGAFDIVVFRHILHHLVGPDLRQTRANQARALDELIRIARPGGWLLFEEEVNNVRAFSRAVYLLSRAAARWRVRCRFFDAGKVVVSFLTRREIQALLDQRARRGDLEAVRTQYTPWPMPLRWKLTLLMSRVGMVTCEARVSRAGGPGGES